MKYFDVSFSVTWFVISVYVSIYISIYLPFSMYIYVYILFILIDITIYLYTDEASVKIAKFCILVIRSDKVSSPKLALSEGGSRGNTDSSDCDSNSAITIT